MKTAEQWMDKWLTTHGLSFEQMIEQAQKEAYNQALEDVINPHEVDMYYDENVGFCIVKQSILKLKK